MVGDLETMFVRGYAESSSFLLVLEKLSPCAACSRGCRCNGLADPPAGAPGARLAAGQPTLPPTGILSLRFVLGVTHPLCPCAPQTGRARRLSVCCSCAVQGKNWKKVPDAPLVTLMPKKRLLGVKQTPVRCADLEAAVEELTGYVGQCLWHCLGGG